MITIENLSVAFDGTEVVKNVSLQLEDGEILGVVVESGSGKSVTALTLMGLAPAEAQVTSGPQGSLAKPESGCPAGCGRGE